MPRYDFECIDCSHSFEHERPMGSTDLPKCPECDSENTHKLIAPPPVIFKGNGFYKTDAGSREEKKPKKEEPKETADKPSSKGTESEKKPEKKPQTEA